MIQKNINSLSIWFFENLLKYREICHFISTRNKNNGFSPSPYDSLNLSFHVGDEPENVLKNRKLLASALGFSVNDFLVSKQVHGGNVKVITEKKYNLCATDAMVTDIPGICLMVLVADCVPILFYDPKQKVIGAAHSGWAGTISKIARNTIDTMIKKYSSKPEDIIVSIGPAIGPCCYEVKLDVVEKVQTNLNKDKEKIIITRNNKYYFDLCKANKLQLLSSGIPEENIEIAGVCTKCNNHLFFSARKAKKTGRFGAGIMLRKQR